MGKLAKGQKPDKSQLQKLYVKESRSIREIADSLGCSKDMVYRTLQEYGIERRPNLRRSKLRQFSIIELEKEVKKKGIRGFSRELGIDESTLRHHLKVHKLRG